MKKRPNKSYAVWLEADEYFDYYQELEDIDPDNYGGQIEIYKCSLKRLGKFERQTKLVKVKKTKEKKKNG